MANALGCKLWIKRQQLGGEVFGRLYALSCTGGQHLAGECWGSEVYVFPAMLCCATSFYQVECHRVLPLPRAAAVQGEVPMASFSTPHGLFNG